MSDASLSGVEILPPVVSYFKLLENFGKRLDQGLLQVQKAEEIFIRSSNPSFFSFNIFRKINSQKGLRTRFLTQTNNRFTLFPMLLPRYRAITNQNSATKPATASINSPPAIRKPIKPYDFPGEHASVMSIPNSRPPPAFRGI